MTVVVKGRSPGLRIVAERLREDGHRVLVLEGEGPALAEVSAEDIWMSFAPKPELTAMMRAQQRAKLKYAAVLAVREQARFTKDPKTGTVQIYLPTWWPALAPLTEDERTEVKAAIEEQVRKAVG